jgi:hypothetical protein
VDAQVLLPTNYPDPVGVITRATKHRYTPPSREDLRQHLDQGDPDRLESQGDGAFILGRRNSEGRRMEKNLTPAFFARQNANMWFILPSSSSIPSSGVKRC